MNILLVEDDAETAYYISHGLSGEGHCLGIAADGVDGLHRARNESWHLLIIDRMLPGLDGLSLVNSLRAESVPTPVLFLTTLGGVDDRVNGLNAGADDYLIKPFSFAELAARVAALGRRSRGLTLTTTLTVADLEMDLLLRTVLRAGCPVELVPREFQLLQYLMEHKNQIVTRRMLLEKVWDVHFEPNTTVVETHMSRLRSKIDRGHGVALLHTVRGTGYSLRDPA